MHGLIFVTWEKYLTERFGNTFLKAYREIIGETSSTAPLVSRVYDDAILLAGVGAASQLAHFPAEVLLREYGRYFLINGLTSHLCMYLLSQIHSTRDLLLTMRQAHAQMHHIPDGLTPPIFAFEALPTSTNGLVLLYDSNRQLCPVLHGAIEGAAERYGERVYVAERSCMKLGDPVCRFEIHFSPSPSRQATAETEEQAIRQATRQQLAELVLNALPDQEGMTLGDVQRALQRWQVNSSQLRPTILLEALHHLQHAGLVASSANHPGDDLGNRRYWRVSTQLD